MLANGVFYSLLWVTEALDEIHRRTHAEPSSVRHFSHVPPSTVNTDSTHL